MKIVLTSVRGEKHKLEIKYPKVLAVEVKG